MPKQTLYLNMGCTIKLVKLVKLVSACVGCTCVLVVCVWVCNTLRLGTHLCFLLNIWGHFTTGDVPGCTDCLILFKSVMWRHLAVNYA